MTFLPIKNYSGYQHVLGANGIFFHPNGNAYIAVCEQKSGIRQNLSIYRLPSGSSAWELVREYQGTIDSQAQITYGGVGIGPGGNMLVVTSLVLVGVPKVTTTGFVGAWVREFGIDEPYNLSSGNTALEARIAALEQYNALLELSLSVVNSRLNTLENKFVALKAAI
jgi:hypothetical protein